MATGGLPTWAVKPVSCAASRIGVNCVGSVVTLRYPDGESERLKVTRIPDDDVPTATPESPLGRALLGAGIGDEIEWAAPEGRLHARVESIDTDVGAER